nr:hypothetical protein [Chitinophagaceae bacterium]
MKRITFLFLTLFYTAILQAQNWHGVALNDTTYFLSKNKNGLSYTNDTNLVRAIFIIAIQQNGTDTTYRFFHSLRPFFPPTACLDSVNSPSWMGPEVIRNPYGVERYFNYRNDEIVIQTYAQVNDTWKITTDTT